MCNEKEAGRAGRKWKVERGMFLGDTRRPNAFDHEIRSTILALKITTIIYEADAHIFFMEF